MIEMGRGGRFLVLGGLSLALLGGCVAGVEEGAGEDERLGAAEQALLYPPPAPASGNIADSTTYLGTLPVDGAVGATFNQNPEYFSWSLSLPAGAVSRVEVTHLGSSMYLDTGLFLYGPRDASGSFGTTLVASDDESGYGQLSKIVWWGIQQGGEYLAVVSSGTGAGKRFRLAHTCLNGACDGVTSLSLVDEPVSASLEAEISAADAGCQDCSGSLGAYSFAWPYELGPDLALAVDAVQGLQDIAYYGFWNQGEIPLSSLSQSLLPSFQPVLPSILAELGNGTEQVRVADLYTSYPVAPGADAWHHAYVLLFPQSHRVVVLQQIVYET